MASATTPANPQTLTVPTAAAQAASAPKQILHSVSAGLTIHRTAQLRNEYRSGGREFAREVAEHVNRTQAGVATIFLYEEAFGVHDRIHWLIHMNGLRDYLTLISMAVRDESFREIFFRQRIPPEQGGGDWSRMFPDGAVAEHVLAPVDGTGAGEAGAPALLQTPLAPDEVLHSANSGLIVERTGVARAEHAETARAVALEAARHVNRELSGIASMFVYEEMFGVHDRLHWLIHVRSLDAYEPFLAFWKRDPDLAAILGANGGWRRLFLDGSVRETVLIPHFAGGSGTVKR